MHIRIKTEVYCLERLIGMAIEAPAAVGGRSGTSSNYRRLQSWQRTCWMPNSARARHQVRSCDIKRLISWARGTRERQHFTGVVSNKKINRCSFSPAGTERKFSWGKRGNEEREGGGSSRERRQQKPLALAGTRAAAVPNSIFTVRLGAVV